MRSLGLCTFLNNCLRYTVLVRFPDPSFGELYPRRKPLDEVHEGADLLVLSQQLFDDRLAYEVLCVAELSEVFLFLDLFKRLNPHFLNEMLCHHFCKNGSQALLLRLGLLLFHLQLLGKFVEKFTHLDLRVSDLFHTSCNSKMVYLLREELRSASETMSKPSLQLPSSILTANCVFSNSLYSQDTWLSVFFRV